MEFKHVSVLLNECIDGLNIKQDGIYVDGTLGGAGHSSQVLKRLGENGRLIGIDQDTKAIQVCSERLKDYRNAILVHDNFSNIKEILQNLHIKGADGILLDLGVSSYQLDTPERGFSYMQDAPLDMRMNPDSDFTAWDIVNGYDRDELHRVIRDFGEDKWSSRIAEFIVKAREKKSIDTTFELVDIIKSAIPASARRDGPHPAKRTFQAIRIEVNGELDILEESINSCLDCLNSGGRLCVITFHSLEDRIVKNVYKKRENPCTCPPELPVCVCGKKPDIRIITRKPIVPSQEETDDNARARSAKLRVAERL